MKSTTKRRHRIERRINRRINHRIESLPKRRYNAISSYLRHELDLEGCLKILEDDDAPWQIRDFTATLLMNALLRQYR
jgi:hypothetical protein